MHQETTEYVVAIATLNALNGDPESDHGIAEDIVMTYLRQTGQAAIADAFEQARDRVGFWYS
jgi:hypothetical protein